MPAHALELAKRAFVTTQAELQERDYFQTALPKAKLDLQANVPALENKARFVPQGIFPFRLKPPAQMPSYFSDLQEQVSLT